MNICERFTVRVAPWVLVLACAAPRPATASRAEWFGPADLVVMADVIVHGRVVWFSAAPGEADLAEAVVAVEGVLKGASPGGAVRARYRLPRVGTPHGYYLSSTTLVLRPGQRYVLYLVARRPGESFHWLVERTDGAAPDTPALRAEVRALVRQARPGTWRSDARGVRTLLLGPTAKVAVDQDLDLKILVQVTGARAMTYRRVRWPERTMAWTELEVRHAGRRLPFRPHPHVTKAEREAYFQRHDQPYRRPVLPWDVVVVHAQRVNTADRGWGYKEDLRFRYYPTTAPGSYVIRARLHRVLDGLPVIETAPLSLTLLRPTGQPRHLRWRRGRNRARGTSGR